jgi:hypothetical protein
MTTHQDKKKTEGDDLGGLLMGTAAFAMLATGGLLCALSLFYLPPSSASLLFPSATMQTAQQQPDTALPVLAVGAQLLAFVLCMMTIRHSVDRMVDLIAVCVTAYMELQSAMLIMQLNHLAHHHPPPPPPISSSSKKKRGHEAPGDSDGDIIIDDEA